MSVAVEHTLSKSNLGEERIDLAYTSRSPSIIEGVRAGAQAGT